jgi:hypothetical protein
VQEPLSPELALVDPELAARARAALPELRLDEPVPRPAQAPRPHPRSRVRGGVRAAAAVVLVASLALNVNLLTEHRSTAQAEAPATDAVTAAPPRTKPLRSGVKAAVEVRKTTAATASKPRLPKRPRSTRPTISHAALRWPAARAARSYDVVLWRSHNRVADVWTTRPAVDLRTLPCIQRRPLAKGGRYLWFVYPLLHSRPRVRFGPLIRWGILEVPRGGLSCG